RAATLDLADAVLDGILEQWLQRHRRQQARRGFAADAQVGGELRAEASLLDREEVLAQRDLLAQRDALALRQRQRAAEELREIHRHLARGGRIEARERADRVEAVEQEVRVDLGAQHLQLGVAREHARLGLAARGL